MRQFGGIEPLVAVDFVIANDVADPVRKDFRAASGKRINPCRLKLLERLANRQFRTTREVGHLDHGERFQVHLRETLLQPGTEIEKVLERQVGMKPTDNVKFRYRFAVSRGSGFESLFE